MRAAPPAARRPRHKPLGPLSIFAAVVYAVVFGRLLLWIYGDHQRESLRRARKAAEIEHATARRVIPKRRRVAF